MRSKDRLVLINIVLVVLLSLISCTAKSGITKPPSISSSTPLPPTFSTKIGLTATYTPSPTSIPSTFILPSPTEMLSPLLSGRVLFEGDTIKDGVKAHGIVILNTKTDESILAFKENQEVNNQLVSLDYPSITWSPNGHWFAFVGTDTQTDNSGNRYQDVYIVRSDGAEIYQLTDSPQYQKFYLSWSPDEKYILVAMGINGSSLYLIDSNSGAVVRRLTTDANSYSAVWSPNGEQIAFKRYGGLAVMNINDEVSRALDIPYNLDVKDISWSSNNEQIAFTASGDSSCTDIFMINVNTGGFINLTISNNYENSPVWLPDGKHLVFSRSSYLCESEGSSWDIYTTNLLHEEYKAISNTGYWTTVAWAPVPNLEIDRRYTITELGAFLNLRTEPSVNGKILEKLPAGEIITVLEGFVDADNYYWWKIRTQDGTEGWGVEVANWYKPLDE